MSLLALFWIGLGGAFGSILPTPVAVGIRTDFPWATRVPDVIGCLLIGPETGSADWAHHSRGFVVVGFCGGFATFSTFGLQTIMQLEAGDIVAAFVNVFLSLFVCLIAVWAGIKLGTFMFQGG